jgi:hypothetical protein
MKPCFCITTTCTTCRTARPGAYYLALLGVAIGPLGWFNAGYAELARHLCSNSYMRSLRNYK